MNETISTIVAPITAPGLAAVAIVRVSGPQVRSVVSSLCREANRILLDPNRMVLSEIFDNLKCTSDTEKAALDSGLICFFRSPASFTGEDCVEFHVHASPFVIERLVENIISLGCVAARAGEFSERAFKNGRLDLSQAEAIADLIAAETESQARVAHEQLRGKLSLAISKLGEPLRDTLAQVEANIDFPEEDIAPETSLAWQKVITEITKLVENYIDSFQTGKIYREGARVVIAGLPNAGKSSLLNAILGEERAIVTPIPGTTRDSIEERISLDGLYLRLCDTAGLHIESASRTPDEVEKIGIETAWERVKNADLVLYVYDASGDLEKERQLIESVSSSVQKIIVVGNKLDLIRSEKKSERIVIEDIVYVSAKTKAGFTELRTRIKEQLLGSKASRNSSILITTRRHVEALKLAQLELTETLQAIDLKRPPEIVSLHIRSALGHLNDIIGVTHTEDILGRIFSQFCIGK